MNQFDEHIFQMGWFNHQAVYDSYSSKSHIHHTRRVESNPPAFIGGHGHDGVLPCSSFNGHSGQLVRKTVFFLGVKVTYLFHVRLLWQDGQ